jgi:hypothetical protein
MSNVNPRCGFPARFEADILVNVIKPDFSEDHLYAAQSVASARALAAVYRAAGYFVKVRAWQVNAGPHGARGAYHEVQP